MSNRQQPIAVYIVQLAKRLHLPAAERDVVLAEVRVHLEERAATLRDTGIADEQAERQAVQTFGNVRHISRQLHDAHRVEWGVRRWIAGVAVGAGGTWVLWLAGTVPAMVVYFTQYPTYSLDAHGQSHVEYMPLVRTIIQSSPLASGAFYAYLTFGWLWLLPLLGLYLVVPFLWGRRARRWWTPGLAYGIGTWLSIPWFGLEIGSSDWAFSAEARIVALALPLALVASYIGWRQRQPSAAAHMLAA